MYINALVSWLTVLRVTQRLPLQGVGEGATPFPGLLHFTLDPYLIMLSVKQGSIKYHFLKSLVALWVVCSPMVWETWVQSQVASYQRLLKWYLIPPCLILSNIRYVSRVTWSNPGKGVAPSPTSWCSSNWKGSLLVALDYSRQLYGSTSDWNRSPGPLANNLLSNISIWVSLLTNISIWVSLLNNISI